jgi:hypothetical protein
MRTFDADFRTKTWSGRRSSRVIVLTAMRTCSAGFDLAAMLAKHGATMVGAPSSQAGNWFIDGLPFRLANSGLTGSISYKESLMFPDDPTRGELLRPDVDLSYERIASMGFDPEASVALALELAQSQTSRH